MLWKLNQALIFGVPVDEATISPIAMAPINQPPLLRLRKLWNHQKEWLGVGVNTAAKSHIVMAHIKNSD